MAHGNDEPTTPAPGELWQDLASLYKKAEAWLFAPRAARERAAAVMTEAAPAPAVAAPGRVREGVLTRKHEALEQMLQTALDTIGAVNRFPAADSRFNSEQEIREDFCRKIDVLRDEFAAGDPPCAPPVFPRDAVLIPENEAGVSDLQGLAAALKRLLSLASVSGALTDVPPGFRGLRRFSYFMAPGFTNAAYLISPDGRFEVVLGVRQAISVEVRFTGGDTAVIEQTDALYRTTSILKDGQDFGPVLFSRNPDVSPGPGVLDMCSGSIQQTEHLLLEVPKIGLKIPLTVESRGSLIKTGLDLRHRGVPGIALLFGTVTVPSEVPVIGGFRALFPCVEDEEEKPKPKVPPQKRSTLDVFRLANRHFGLNIRDEVLQRLATINPSLDREDGRITAAGRLLEAAGQPLLPRRVGAISKWIEENLFER